MRKINIIYAGGMKEKYYKEAVNEYIKRLSAQFKIENIEIKEIMLPENPSNGEIESCLKKEGEKILEKLYKIDKTGKNSFKIALCVEGEKLSSEDFALLLYGEKASNAQSVDFFIGSSHGLSDKVKKSADFMLSFSDMTFPHSLIRVMLTEQIYRAYAIKAGKKYHK